MQPTNLSSETNNTNDNEKSSNGRFLLNNSQSSSIGRFFCELHAHTEYSNVRLTDSIIRLTDLLDTAYNMGLKGVAITDHECLSGHIKAIKHYFKNKDKLDDFKLILGNEIYLIDRKDYKNTNNFWHFVLLAKDKEGHRQLRELSSRAWHNLYVYKKNERVPTFYDDLEEVVGANKGHLIGLTACIGGEFANLINNNQIEQAKTFVKWCQSIFGEDDFYIEMQPAISEEQTSFNDKALSFAKHNNIGWVFTNDAHYLTKDKADLHASYLNSKDEEREVKSFYESTYLKTPIEMLSRLSYLNVADIKQGFENTIKIADKVKIYDLAQDIKVPKRKLPKEIPISRDYPAEYEYINLFKTSLYEQDRYLLSCIEQGLEEKNVIVDNTILERIDIELKQLWLISDKLNQRMSAYYNLVKQLIDIMWDDNKGNSLVGAARGSVTGFYICYLIGITQIDPIKWNLPYWRHLTAERPELPKPNWAFEVNPIA